MAGIEKLGISRAISAFNGYLDMAEQFLKIQPVYYDEARNWWLWNDETNSWELIDETDLLIEVDKAIRVATTINPNEKSKILEALRRVGRQNKPEDLPKTWVQFKDTIVDITTGNRYKPDPKYFTTNPIPWKVGESEATPNIDRILTEWVGEENTTTLHEIIAYCLLSDYFLHRMFCFVGSGLNGKSKYLELLSRFVGYNNRCSTELDILLNSRFEVTKLYKKLVCIMGETNINILNKTSLIKRLCGQDTIGYEFKNKTPFNDYNYAKILIATNSLPATSDKTDGFYRRWLIIDFPNRFSEKKDILADIPDQEYENLAKKSISTLRQLLERREFTNEGTLEQRQERYESRSNPLCTFINEECVKNPAYEVPFWKFYDEFVVYSQEKGHRIISRELTGRILKAEGFEKGLQNNERIIRGLQLKNQEIPQQLNVLNDNNVLPT
jgi:putative DNA primase/helicase